VYVPKVLARGFAALTTLAAFAAASPALGGNPVSTSFSGSFPDFEKQPGGTIEFVLDKGKKDKVHDISITDMAASCAGRAAALDFNIYGNTKVYGDRSFAVRSEDGLGAKAIVRGEFSRRFSRAEGTARLNGKFDIDNGAGRTSCESGKQKFKATVSG
jgi:hypothetical protein